MEHIARDEVNLATVPFIRPAKSDRSSPVHIEWTAEGRDGETHDFFQTIYPGTGMKLPGPTAGRVILALLSASKTSIVEDPLVETNYDEIGRLVRLQKSGTRNETIRTAIKRLQGLTVETNSFWTADLNTYTEESTIELFSGHHLSRRVNETNIQVRWTEENISLMRAWSKPLNINYILNLYSLLARRLLQVSQMGIYQEGCLVEDLRILCHGYLGVSQSRKYPSELKRSLKGPIESLKRRQLVHVKVEEDDSMPSGHVVIARPEQQLLEIYEGVTDLQYWR